MNIRIEGQDLKFKISEDELNILNLGNSVDMETNVAGQILQTKIQCHDLCQSMNVQIECINNNIILLLLGISPSFLENLNDIGRSREGVCVVTDDVSLTLQVDFRKDKRPTRKDS